MFESSQTRRNVQVYQFSNYTSLIQSHKSLGLIKKINTISVIACYSTTKSQHIILKKITAQDSICTVQFHTILHHTHTISYLSIMVWCDVVWWGVVRCDGVWYDVVRWGVVWCDGVWYDVAGWDVMWHCICGMMSCSLV